MSKRHKAIFDDVLKGLDTDAPVEPAAAPARALKRSNALAEIGEREEKVLRWVDPARCRMWERHNRAYGLLTEENCADLIQGIRAQGQQEFPAIVRRVTGEEGVDYEVICGARRHFAISWLRANNYPGFRYLVEVRELSDEEAFRLSDIENRDREDLSDYERAIDYARALDLYYDGRQKAMAQRLDVSEGWLSRFLQLARLPEEIVSAWPSVRELRELHARSLKPFLAAEDSRARVLDAAVELRDAQASARLSGQGGVPVAEVLTRLRKAGEGKAAPRKAADKGEALARGVILRRKGRKSVVEIDGSVSEAELRKAFEALIAARSRV
ncbi:ParB/RepB/Spo0J family partition protein [Oceanicella sp. SM1341]|uniref:ParB/RepB/Spo0J family partition protein n=1 Tax=Oceanicella sp. SM1341 TaxID=1548889 RepID=UPI000E545A78|nr:ParB/RepB/Spo0J family partition protein [Oceanicella sp. SM1341]